MTDLKDFYQQQFHKLEKVSDILSEVIIEFQKRIDGYPKTYNLLSSIDGMKFKEVQDLESFRQNLSFSSDKTEIIYSSTKRELELWFCLYKPIYIEYIDDNLRNDVYTMILDVLSNIKLHNSKDLKLEKVKTEMHNFLFNQSNKIEDLPLFIERINNITNVESKNKMIRINRDVFEVYAE